MHFQRSFDVYGNSGLSVRVRVHYATNITDIHRGIDDGSDLIFVIKFNVKSSVWGSQ